MTEQPTRVVPPGAIYERAAAFQRELALSQTAAQDQMLAAWGRMYEATVGDLQAVLDKVAAARAAGTEVSPAWLYQEARLRTVLDTVEAEVATYASQATNATTAAQQAAVNASARHSALLGEQALAEGASMGGSFLNVNPDNLRHLVGFLADGSPLSGLLAGLAPEVSESIRQALVVGVGQGKGIDWMARQVTQALDMPRHRAVTIMRTESQRAYRETARQTYQENADVLQGWVWTAALGPRTCAACIAMHGTIHPVTETLDGHPRCRCAMVPRTPSWADLGVPDMEDDRPPVTSGKDWFQEQPDAVQRGILGRAKWQAWKDGRISLDDTVARTHSADWGTMRRERSLVEIQDGRHANTLPKAPGAKAQAPAALAPEPAYVEKLAAILDQGGATPAQLLEHVKDASPLARVNADEAIRVHLARREAQEAARAARGGPREFASAQEARDWANAHWAGPQGYPPEELAVLRDYTGSAYGPMNNTLRSSKGKRTNAKIRTMDAAMERAARVPDDIQVIRNANLRQLGITGSRVDPRTAVGRVLEEHGYLSTSINRKGAMQGEVRLSINVPKGSRGIYMSGDGGRKGPGIISDYGGGESELILDRGSRLTIRSVRKVGNRWHVEADLDQPGRGA